MNSVKSAYGQKRKPLEVAVLNEHVPIILYLLEHERMWKEGVGGNQIMKV